MNRNLRFVRPDKARETGGSPPEQNAMPTQVPALEARACCCLANPVVVAIMPVTEEHPDAVDIHLCAHHYRILHRALAEAGAIIFNRDAVLILDDDTFDLV